MSFSLNLFSGWKQCVFEDLFDIPLRNGLSKPKRVRGSGIKMVNMGEVFSYDRIFNPEMEKVPVSDNEYKTSILKKGDLLFARQSLVLEGAGKCSIVMNEREELTFESHLIRVRLNQEISDPLFYFYFFQSSYGKKVIYTIVEQVSAAGIRGSDLKKLPVPFPEKNEQERISNFLTKLDDKLDLNNQINQNLEELAQAIFKAWFIDFEPFQDGEFEESEMGMVPKGWTIESLYNLADYINGAAFRSKDFSEKGIPIVKISELKNGITDQTRYFNGEKKEKYYLQNKDVLFSWSGSPQTSLDAFIWDKGKAILNQHIFKVVPKEKISKAFMYILLKYMKPTFIRIAMDKQTTGLGHLTVKDLKRLKVVLPDENTMTNFNKIVNPLFDKLYLNKLESENLAQIRDTLLPKLMSGEIRVPLESD